MKDRFEYILCTSLTMLFALLLLSGCAARRGQTAVPEGVDTTTAVESETLGDALYGTPEAETRAEREMERGRADFEMGEELRRAADSLAHIETVDVSKTEPRGLIGKVRTMLCDTT
ncbi:hypothetical protein KKG05_05405, partial [bacterium]|nr:hypothetical protein [bacterium]